MVDRGEALEVLRQEVVGQVFASGTVLAVDEAGPVGFLVRVRAGRRIHPHTLRLAADQQSLTLDHSIGEPVADIDARSWAQGVALWLTEQLATGALRWGRRVTLPDGTVAIDPTLDPDPPSPWHVASLPLERPTADAQRRLLRMAKRRGTRHLVTIGDRIATEPDPTPGSHLLDVGFNVHPGRTAHTQRRLIDWLQLFDHDDLHASLIGQLVVSWQDEQAATAQLEHLEHVPSIPRGAVADLVLAGVHAAADAGARQVEYRLSDLGHVTAGLGWRQVDGIWTLDATELP